MKLEPTGLLGLDLCPSLLFHRKDQVGFDHEMSLSLSPVAQMLLGEVVDQQKGLGLDLDPLLRKQLFPNHQI